MSIQIIIFLLGHPNLSGDLLDKIEKAAKTKISQQHTLLNYVTILVEKTPNFRRDPEAVLKGYVETRGEFREDPTGLGMACEFLLSLPEFSHILQDVRGQFFSFKILPCHYFFSEINYTCDPVKKEKKMPNNTDCGYNIAEESVNLFLAHELYTDNHIDKKNDNVDILVEKMTHLEKFLSLVAERTTDSNRLDLLNAEDQALVDHLRTYDDLRHIFPEGRYSWKEKEIDNLTRMVHQHIEGKLQREITMNTEEMVIERNELTKALQVFTNGMNHMTNSIRQIIANIQKAH